MTMQLTGPISIGQARNECKLTGKIDAKNAALSKLAGVAAGDKYAWSYWYGKSFYPQYNGALLGSYTGYGRTNPAATRYDLRTGGIIQTFGDGHGVSSQNYVIPDFTVYDYVHIQPVFYNPGDLDHPTGWSIYGSQDAANPWLDLAQWSQPGYGTATPVYVYVTALSIAGATSKTYICDSWNSGQGSGTPPFTVPAYGSTPAQSFPDVFSYYGPYQAYLAYQWQSNSSGGGGGGGGGVCCFIAGALVLMSDHSWKPVETIEAGDSVMTPDGAFKVQRLYESTLGSRKMLTFAEDTSIQWSEEHPFWSRKDGKQWWWSANPDMLEEEMSSGLIQGLEDPKSVYNDKVQYAYLDGFVEREIVEVEAEPETKVYIPVLEGPPCIINGYVVGAFMNDKNYDYKKLDWNQCIPNLKHTKATLEESLCVAIEE